MRLDAHMHFWRYNASEYALDRRHDDRLRRDFLPVEAAQEMRQAGIDACVAVQVRQTLEETRWLLALADAHPFIAGVVGWVDLRSGDLDEQIESVKHPKLVGVRHIVQAEADDFLLDEWFPPRRGAAGPARPRLRHPRSMRASCPPLSNLPLRSRGFAWFWIIWESRTSAQADSTGWRRDLDRIASLPNVCAKLSGLVTEADWNRWTIEDLHRYIDAALDAFGPQRLMIGSDWPVCTLAGRIS